MSPISRQVHDCTTSKLSAVILNEQEAESSNKDLPGSSSDGIDHCSQDEILSFPLHRNVPYKASTFVFIFDNQNHLLCTVEHDGSYGVPGGKWERGRDGLLLSRHGNQIVETLFPNHAITIHREFKEETTHDLPFPQKAGYIEWGSDTYQVRFYIYHLDSIPDLERNEGDYEIQKVKWIENPYKEIKKFRPHLRRVLYLLQFDSSLKHEICRMIRK